MKTKCSDTTWEKQRLREHSLRATSARVAVLRVLASAERPVSHAQVVEELANFDQSTLFRCLNELTDAGLASRLHLGDQIRRFELRETNNQGEFTHPHFMCIDCGELSCLSDITVQISPLNGAKLEKIGEITELTFRGHCGQCQKS